MGAGLRDAGARVLSALAGYRLTIGILALFALVFAFGFAVGLAL